MSLTDEEREQGEARSRMLRLHTSPGHLIRRAHQVHTALWTEEFDGEVTGPQYALLSVLASGSMDQRSAGQSASLDKSTAADVVARLARHGWLARRRDAGDRRRYLLSLTTPARSALRHITPRVAAVQRRFLEPLSPDESAWFSAVLARVAFRGEPPAVPADADASFVLLPATAPGHLLRRSEQLQGVYWAQHVGSLLTSPQYALLTAVAWNDDIDQSTAGELASLDKSSTTDVIARLARRGLVTARPDPRDRRRKLIDLTAEAREVVERVAVAAELVQRDLLAPLRADEVTRFVSLLEVLAYRRPLLRAEHPLSD